MTVYVFRDAFEHPFCLRASFVTIDRDVRSSNLCIRGCLIRGFFSSTSFSIDHGLRKCTIGWPVWGKQEHHKYDTRHQHKVYDALEIAHPRVSFFRVFSFFDLMKDVVRGVKDFTDDYLLFFSCSFVDVYHSSSACIQSLHLFWLQNLSTFFYISIQVIFLLQTHDSPCQNCSSVSENIPVNSTKDKWGHHQISDQERWRDYWGFWGCCWDVCIYDTEIHRFRVGLVVFVRKKNRLTS